MYLFIRSQPSFAKRRRRLFYRSYAFLPGTGLEASFAGAYALGHPFADGHYLIYGPPPEISRPVAMRAARGGVSLRPVGQGRLLPALRAQQSYQAL